MLGSIMLQSRNKLKFQIINFCFLHCIYRVIKRGLQKEIMQIKGPLCSTRIYFYIQIQNAKCFTRKKNDFLCLQQLTTNLDKLSDGRTGINFSKGGGLIQNCFICCSI